jgi:hypothetical protein
MVHARYALLELVNSCMEKQNIQSIIRVHTGFFIVGGGNNAAVLH